MDFTIYFDGMPVDCIQATSLMAAQEHADATQSRPVVAVHAHGSIEEIGKARTKSQLLAMPVLNRISLISMGTAQQVLAIGEPESMERGPLQWREAAQLKIAAAIHAAIDCQDSRLIAALRQIAAMSNEKRTTLEADQHAADIALRALIAVRAKP
jgi:hypothetical protein